MGVTKTFQRAVDANQVTAIRIMMKDSLLGDLSHKELEEMRHCAKAVPGLYDVHDGSQMQQDQSTWNDDYMNRMMVEILGNFSHERLEHLKAVVHHLRPYEPPRQPKGNPHVRSQSARSAKRPQSEYQQQKARDGKNGNIRIVRGVAIGAGAVGGALVGAAIVDSVIVGAMAGGVVGGVVGAGAAAFIAQSRKGAQP